MVTSFNAFLIILFSIVQIIKSQLPSNCLSITIDVLDFGTSSFDPDNWDGVFPITNKTSFNAPIWRIPGKDSNKWLKFIQTHWVLSGQNKELLIYNSSSSLPPTNSTSTWTHEYKADPATLNLDCSSSLSPTSSPTPAPTTSPTYSPTVDDCDILTISDTIVSDDTVTDIYFDGWSYQRLEDDYTGRPIWKYQQSGVQSLVQFLNTEGWVVYLNDGLRVNTYSSDGELYGYFPPLNVPVLFNVTTNNQPARFFNFTCLPTDFPTSAPTDSPTLTPTKAPIANPTRAPTGSPNGAPTPPPTSAPTEMPTLAPTIACDILKIDIPIDLLEADNPNCDINFTAIFDSYWVQQISRSNRPSWTLDCADSNPIYTHACKNGYSGTVFFISNQWEIQVHSKNDDCFERFVIDNTGSYFIPTSGSWIDESTDKQYIFEISCSDKVSLPTVSPTAQAFVDQNTVTIVDRAWFWVALVLILLICCVLLIGGYFYNKHKNPVIVQYQHNAPSASIFASRSDLELAENPPAAYVDPNAAPSAGTMHDDDEGDDLKIDEVENDGQSTLRKMGSTAYDPEMNPNLKKNASVVSAISVDAAKRGTIGGRSGSTGENNTSNNEEKTDNGNDLALVGNDDDDDDLAKPSKKDPKEYNQLVGDDDEEEEDETEMMFEKYDTPQDDTFNV